MDIPQNSRFLFYVYQGLSPIGIDSLEIVGYLFRLSSEKALFVVYHRHHAVCYPWHNQALILLCKDCLSVFKVLGIYIRLAWRTLREK